MGFSVISSSSLEVELHRELYQAREVLLIGRDHAEARAGVGSASGTRTDRRVGEVEGLGAELQLVPFLETGVLLDREIQLRSRGVVVVGETRRGEVTGVNGVCREAGVAGRIVVE